MANVKIRVESVSNEELESQRQGQEVSGGGEKLVISSVFVHQTLSLAKQTISTGLNNIGNFTGNYVKQDQVQNQVEVLSDMASIGIGAMAGGWVGAVVAATGVVFKRITNFVVENQNQLHAERQSEFLKIRSGNSLTNGSRTNIGD